MHTLQEHESSKRRPINLTIREDVVAEAKRLKLNASKAAEAGIVQAIKAQKEQEWKDTNQQAISAHNDRIKKHGSLLKPLWSDE